VDVDNQGGGGTNKNDGAKVRNNQFSK